MTRLDAASEPSMEDILASIRKIIAEDPPGSRPVPTSPASFGGSPQSPSSSSALPTRPSDRERFPAFGSSRDSLAASQSGSLSSEPNLNATTSNASPAFDKAAFEKEPFFAPQADASSMQTASTGVSGAAPANRPSRIEPSFAALSPAASSPAADAFYAKPSALSVDEQLSGLLGETASVTIQKPATIAGGSAGLGSQLPEVASTADKIEPRAELSTTEPDPFDFDLGPPPSAHNLRDVPASVPAPMVPNGNSLTARMSASSIERISAPYSASREVGSATSEAGETAALAAAPIEPSTVTSTTDASEEVVAEPVVVASFAAPSVAATLAPQAFVPATTPEPIARFIPSNAGIETSKPNDRDVLEMVAPSRTSAARADSVADSREDAIAERPTFATSTAVTVSSSNAPMRTMEETVAELLRPMLKAWLAENMPRIVERALRRELNEQAFDQKDAAE